MRRLALLLLFLVACGESGPVEPAADSSIVDARVQDVGFMDAEVRDAGAPDVGVPDTGAPDSGPSETWESGIQPLFTAYCVPCHDTGNRNRDYNLFADAFRDRDEVRCGVAPAGMRPSGCSGFPPPGQFPIGTGAKPSNDERVRIVTWIEAGAPER